MIRYAILPDGKTPITQETLRAAILADVDGHEDPDVKEAVKGWVEKADDRTAQLLLAGSYIDSKRWQKLPAAERAAIEKPIDLDWSSVKYLFMEIQHDKCAYCERKLAAREDGGAIEHDVEHFRPKNPIKDWKTPKEIDFATGEAGDEGYYWLAFHLLNYSTACKKCNSGFKKNHFPVAGKRLKPPDIPTAGSNKRERPFLIYPLGLLDDDPEELIRFQGLSAHPPSEDPILAGNAKDKNAAHRDRRARVTIAFFGLNKRDELLWGRAEKLRELEKSLALINYGSETERKNAQADIRQLTDGFREHTACIKAMIRLYRHDVEKARMFFDAVRAYLDSKTPVSYHKFAKGFMPVPSPPGRARGRGT